MPVDYERFCETILDTSLELLAPNNSYCWTRHRAVNCKNGRGIAGPDFFSHGLCLQCSTAKFWRERQRIPSGRNRMICKRPAGRQEAGACQSVTDPAWRIKRRREIFICLIVDVRYVWLNNGPCPRMAQQFLLRIMLAFDKALRV